MKRFTCVVGVTLAAALAGCGSKADTVSKNLSTEAENFKVVRHIVGVNGITDKVEFEITGLCSLERGSLGLELICKEGPNDFRKHYLGLSDNMFFVSTQVSKANVSEYRTKIILKPSVPDLDLVTG